MPPKAAPRRPGRFVSAYAGAGVHHVAFSTSDIERTAKQFEARRAPLLAMPVNYYDDLSARWGLDDATLAALQQHGLLYDRDAAGEFWHLYTDAFHDRFFFEAVQRSRRLYRFRCRQCPRPRRRPGPPAPRRTRSAVTDTLRETLAMVPQNEFIQRDRSQHPPALTPDYKTSVLRSPRLPLWSLQNSLSELTGPGVRTRGAGAARSRPDPELCQDRRTDRRAHHRPRPRSGREWPRRAEHAGRSVAGQRRRTLPAQERHLPRADRSEFRRLRPDDHGSRTATMLSAPSSPAPIRFATTSIPGGPRTFTSRCPAPASPSG